MTYRDYLYSKASRERIPLGGTFELSPVCNFACRMCYVRRTRDELRAMGKQEITADQWIALAQQCRDAGMLYLLLTGGEPFIYPEFRRLYETLHDMGFLLSINSNGTMIDENVITWLKARAPTRMNITLYGASRETYGKLCHNPDGYDHAVRGIELLVNAGIHVVINGSITPENKEDLPEIIQFAHSHGCRANVATYMFPPVRRASDASDSRLTAEESGYLSVIKERYRLGDEKFLEAAHWMLDKLSDSRQQEQEENWGDNESHEMRCRAGRSSCWINWEGKMTACGMMDFPVATEPFLNGFQPCWETLTETVRRQAVLHGCSGCAKKDLCHPCTAMIQAETGTVTEKAPYLCRMAEVSEQIWKEQLASMEDKT